MHRIIVIGPGGAGKSTFSRALGAKLGLPVHHLDRMNWQAGWVERDRAAFRDSLLSLMQDEQWIIDGHYGGTLHDRAERADTIVYLDYPVPLCLWRLVKRRLAHRVVARPDMADDCPERLDLSFLVYVAKWPWAARRRAEAKLAEWAEKVVRLTSPASAERWLDSLNA